MARKSNPALEKREEQQHKDLDGDGEKGESRAHRAKVFGKGSAGGSKPPLPFAAPKKGSGKGGTMCPACTKAGKKSCSHR